MGTRHGLRRVRGPLPAKRATGACLAERAGGKYTKQNKNPPRNHFPQWAALLCFAGLGGWVDHNLVEGVKNNRVSDSTKIAYNTDRKDGIIRTSQFLMISHTSKDAPNQLTKKSTDLYFCVLSCSCFGCCRWFWFCQTRPSRIHSAE